jgi:hypothetical protein
MAEQVPAIEGNKSVADEVAERVAEQRVIEQVTLLDQVPPIPTDENQYSRDIKESKTQEEKVTKAKSNNRQHISEKQRATLAKARAALAEKRRLEKTDGQAGKQGTPADDILVNISKRLDTEFKQIYDRLDNLKTIVPYEYPLQTNHIVPDQKQSLREHPTENKEYMYHRRNDNKRNITISDSGMEPSNNNLDELVAEQKKITKKLKTLFEQFNFNTTESINRTGTDPTASTDTQQTSNVFRF